MNSQKLRLPAEEIHAAELEALVKGDDGTRPPNWRLSPQSVVTYLLGGKAKGWNSDLIKIHRQPAPD